MSRFLKFSAALGDGNGVSPAPGQGDVVFDNSKPFTFMYPGDLFKHGPLGAAYVMFTIKSSNFDDKSPAYGRITLFMPATLSISYGAHWDEIELPLQKILSVGKDVVETARKVMETSSSTAGGIVGALKEIGHSDFAKHVVYNATKKMSPSLSGELVRSGYIKSPGDNAATINPFASLNYGTPQYRQLQLKFDFFAKNEDESKNIRLILKAFKMAMHPGKKSAGDQQLFWDAPYIFNIDFYTTAKGHKNMFNFKKSALIDMSVDYGAAGIQTFFKDGHPVHISAELRFKELAFLTREDVDKNY